MTSGKPGKRLLYFAIPMVLGNLFQQLYNIMDSVIVGNYIGADALAAVGASTSITFLFIAIATGTGIGASVIISQYFGAGEYGKMKSAICTILISAVILSAVLTGVGLMINNKILELMRTPQMIFEDAATYLRIYFIGLIFLFVYNTLTAVFNAIGRSKIPLMFLIFSSILNIVLDILFVTKFKMGVAGVAIATLIAQGISAFLSSIVLVMIIRRFHQESFQMFDYTILKKICQVAIPSTIQQSIVSIGSMLVQTLVNGYGPVIVAGYTAAIKIDSIAIMPMVNVGSAVSTFTAQNIGAKKTERVYEGLKAALAMVFIIGAGIAFLLFLFGEQVIGMFVDTATNQDVIKVGVDYLRVVSVFYVVMGTMNNFNGVLRGAGDMKVFMICTLCNLGTRVILAYILAAFSSIGARAIWWSIPIGWTVGLIVAVLRVASGKWKNKSLVS